MGKITLFLENHIFANIILSTQNVFDSLQNNKIHGQSLSKIVLCFVHFPSIIPKLKSYLEDLPPVYCQ